MGIGPILRALINHRSRFWLITIEIALTLAIVVNCVGMILDQRAKMLRPTGLDEENILVVTLEPFAPEFQEEAFVESVYAEDLRMLRALPGVIAATGTSSVPLSGGGSSTGRRRVGSEEQSISAPYFVVGEQALESFGVRLVEGRDFDASDFAGEESREGNLDSEHATHDNVLLTRALADLLFPDGGAVGGLIESSSGESVEHVIGIIERMHCSWPRSSVVERVMLYPGRPAGSRRSRYAIRAEPEMVQDLYTRVEADLLGLNDGRLVKVETLAEIKADTYADDVAFSRLLGGLSVMLVLVTSLGIVGLTAFSVTQRTHEIGTRRALGATRTAILRHFLVENWLVTTSGLTLGLLLAYSLNFVLAHLANVPRLGLGQVVAGMLGLWLVGLLAALAPALRGMGISPVIATRNVY